MHVRRAGWQQYNSTTCEPLLGKHRGCIMTNTSYYVRQVWLSELISMR